MKNSQSIRSLFALPGFVVGAGLKGLFGDRYARVIQLKRRKKQLCALTVGQRCRGRYDKQVCRVRDLSLAGWRIYLEYERFKGLCQSHPLLLVRVPGALHSGRLDGPCVETSI